jgi:hypothetical protein
MSHTVCAHTKAIKPIRTEIESVYKELQSQVVWLHGRWICYRQLYAASPKRIDLLNESGATFFFFVKDVLYDEVQVTLSKLTDPATTSRKFENLSLKQLQGRLASFGDASLTVNCRKLLETLRLQCAPFRLRRHKKLAHLDLSTALRIQSQPLPAISRQMVEDALLTIRTYLNTIEAHYNVSELMYEHFVMTNDGEALVATLRAGQRYEELVKERQIPFDDWRKGKWHDA